jgi:hypothetical protein
MLECVLYIVGIVCLEYDLNFARSRFTRKALKDGFVKFNPEFLRREFEELGTVTYEEKVVSANLYLFYFFLLATTDSPPNIA